MALVGRKLSYETRARMRNARIAKKLPLFAATGTLDEVVGRPPWTPEEVRADEEHHRRVTERMLAQMNARSEARCVAYRAWLVSLVGEHEVRAREAQHVAMVARQPSLGQPAYRADWLNRQIAGETGLTSPEIYRAIGARMEVDDG